MPRAAAGFDDPAPGSVAALARQALELAQGQPQQAWRLATTALAGAGSDAEARSVAEQALGLAAVELRDLDEAVRHLRAAVRIATRARMPTCAAEAHVGLSYVLLGRGDPRGALREADRAAAVLRGRDAARLQVRRALVLQRLGRLDEALEGYRRALPVLRRTGDRLWEARLLCNRGVLHAYRGEFAAAEHDLELAERLHQELGQALAAAQVRHNLGFVAARRGDVPAALAWYDSADDDFRTLGVPAWVRLADRCELLLSVRLLAEARALAEQAVVELGGARRASDLAEARLALAQVALLQGDESTARTSAEEARRAFARQRRAGWAALARYVALRAEWEAGARSPQLLAAAGRAARELAVAGWAVPAADARLISARTALELGRRDLAHRELRRVGAARRRGPLDVRARAWHAEALLRLADGNLRGAEAALRAGMRAVSRQRAILGATELRAHVAGHAGELATLGLRLALDARAPHRVLRWAERWRAGALQLRPARPPADDQLASDLAELRQVVSELDDAALAGRDTRRLLHRQVVLERAIQRRSRQATGAVAGDLDGVSALAALPEALGERVLVELVRLDGQLHAVTIVRGRARLTALGPADEPLAELDDLRFALRRLACADRAPAAQAAALHAARHAAERIDAQLLRPLAAEVGDRPLVIVPTGALNAVPWSVLPSCAGRPVSVVPSALVWLQALERARRPDIDDRVVLVAAADPPHATAEVLALRALYPRAEVLMGPEATAAAVAAALDGADLAHLACHGRFRADNPLFSYLQLSDGPLTVYDLERLGQAPRVIVLSACESGLSRVEAGDEVMGLASAAFALGTATLLASVAPVPDAATRDLMLRFHRGVLAGLAPAMALARAQQDLAGIGDGALAAGAAFVCFGAG